MGLLTLVEMRAELWPKMETTDEYDPTTDATKQARCDRALNFSYQRIQIPSTFDHIEKQASQTIPLVTSTSDYAITLYAIDHMRYEPFFKTIRPMTRRQLSEIRQASGPPTRYARWGGRIYLDYIPSATENGSILTIYGWAAPTTLVTSGAASILTSVWDEVIIVGAAWRAWRSMGDQPRADIFREEYAALVNDNRDILSLEAFDQGFVSSVGPADYQNQ